MLNYSFNGVGEIGEKTFYEQRIINNINKNITLTSLSEGRHNITIFCNDTSGNMGQSAYTYFSTDTLYPNISFNIPPTTDSGTYYQNWVYVNVSASDANLKQVTIRVINSSGEANSTWYTSSGSYKYNFTNLGYGNYYVNASVWDYVNHINSTNTLSIILLAPPPSTLVNYSCGNTRLQFRINGSNLYEQGIEPVGQNSSCPAYNITNNGTGSGSNITVNLN